MRSEAIRTLLAAAALGLLIGAPAGSARAQDEGAPPSKEEPVEAEKKSEDAPSEKPEGGEEPQASEAGEQAPPSLDELLGLEESGEDAGEEPADEAAGEQVDPERAQLERQLEGADISEVFSEAVRQMGDAADLLGRARDPGARTQRLHDEILTKLDVLIEQAEQQSQQSSSSSSSSSAQQQQQQQQQTGQQQRQQQSSQRQSGEPQEQTPPGGQDAQLREALDAARAAWGSLPERVRDALVEGTNETFSSIYKRMTERYYKRLAEEGGSP